MKKVLQLSLLLVMASNAFAQVQFQVEWLESTESYMVSMVSDETWTAPYNITSTAQVSLKVPADGFVIADVVNLQNGVEFELNGVHESPEEAPEFDYLSFGLKSLGTDGLDYEAGKKLPLFTFKNTNECNGAVYLLNGEDAFLPPNSMKANVGNQITVFGAQGNAYVGNVGEGKADCSLASSVEEDYLEATAIIYPNPVQEELRVDFDWKGANMLAELKVYDASGKLAIKQEVNLVKGKNSLLMMLGQLHSGTFSLEVQNDNMRVSLGQFFKS